MTTRPRASMPVQKPIPITAPPAPPPQAPPGDATPQEVCQAYTVQQAQLRNQLSRLTSQRLPIAERLRVGNATGADKTGLERRITVIDDQIIKVSADLAAADARVATQSAVPGACDSAGFVPTEPEVVIGSILTFALFMPVMIAYAKRIWRRGSTAVSTMSGDMSERLGRLEQAVDSIAIEIERIGEGQRFMTNLFVETMPDRSLGAGAMEPLDVAQRQGVTQHKNV